MKHKWIYLILTAEIDGTTDLCSLGYSFIIHCVQEKRDQNVFCNVFDKTRVILIKFDTQLLNNFFFKMMYTFSTSPE